MSANVALSDTFDQWRVKNNELLVITQTDGSDNFIKLTNTTNSTSNTTGSIISTGGIGISKSMVMVKILMYMVTFMLTEPSLQMEV